MPHFIHVNMGSVHVRRTFIENQTQPKLFPPPHEPGQSGSGGFQRRFRPDFSIQVGSGSGKT